MKPTTMSPQDCVFVRPSKAPKYLYGIVAKPVWFYLDPESTKKSIIKEMYLYAESIILEIGSAKGLMEAETLITAPDILEEADL